MAHQNVLLRALLAAVLILSLLSVVYSAPVGTPVKRTLKQLRLIRPEVAAREPEPAPGVGVIGARAPSPSKRAPTPSKRAPTPSKRAPVPSKRAPTPSKRAPTPSKRFAFGGLD